MSDFPIRFDMRDDGGVEPAGDGTWVRAESCAEYARSLCDARNSLYREELRKKEEDHRAHVERLRRHIRYLEGKLGALTGVG